MNRRRWRKVRKKEGKTEGRERAKSEKSGIIQLCRMGRGKDILEKN